MSLIVPLYGQCSLAYSNIVEVPLRTFVQTVLDCNTSITDGNSWFVWMCSDCTLDPANRNNLWVLIIWAPLVASLRYYELTARKVLDDVAGYSPISRARFVLRYRLISDIYSVYR